LAVLRADFRAVIETTAQQTKGQGTKAQEIETRVSECFFFGASVFGTSIPREKANIPREKANGSKPLRLKGPRTLRRV
jgi:hypothetical protein